MALLGFFEASGAGPVGGTGNTGSVVVTYRNNPISNNFVSSCHVTDEVIHNGDNYALYDDSNTNCTGRRLYLSTSNTAWPDVAPGSGFVATISSPQNGTNFYIADFRASAAGTFYVWLVFTRASDGEINRLLLTVPAITVSP